MVSANCSHPLTKYPQYTRPRNFREYAVPEVLLSGNHKEINDFRRKESIKRTFLTRPELIERAKISDQERKYLQNYITERGN